MILLDSTPILKNTLEWSGTSHLSSPSTNLRRGLAARRVFRIPPGREGTIHLQTSIPSPGFEPRLYGAAFSVTNYCTRWAALLKDTNLDIVLRLRSKR
ncbi:hypothetical protein TNCV_3753751 [Trichonephila clavipes]|nr:hypothetical protein TNCV_3753751 [Trichonephila clavipes]